VQPSGNAVDTGWIFFREETTMSKLTPVEQKEPSPYNHQLQQFLNNAEGVFMQSAAA